MQGHGGQWHEGPAAAVRPPENQGRMRHDLRQGRRRVTRRSMVVGMAGGGDSRKSRLAAVLMMLLPISLCLTPPTMYKQPPSLDPDPQWFGQNSQVGATTPWDDPILQVIPPGMPYELMPAYFKRIDFEPNEKVSRKYIGDMSTLPGFHSGIETLETNTHAHFGPGSGVGPDFGLEGPTSFLKPTWLSPLSGPEIELGKLHTSCKSGVPTLHDPGNIREFHAESLRHGSLAGGDDADLHGMPRLKTSLDSVSPREISMHDLMGSRFLARMRAGVDDDLVHPEDRIKNEIRDSVPPPKISSTVMMGDKGQAIFDLSTGFEGERMRIPISLAKEPATMHLDKANAMLSKYEHTLNPVVTGGTVIGIRCKDGTLIAADTMASYGSYQKFTDVQRIHKVNDNIIVAAEGEMADFQEMQTILSDMVQEQEDLRDYLDVCDVRPQQAQHFMSQVMYARRSKQNPMWMTALFGGWGKPCGLELSPVLEDTQVFKERSFLGQVDMHGTPLESNVFATGIGNYIAMPLLRGFTKEVERMEAGYDPIELTLEEAWPVACEVMRVLAARCSQCSDRIQIGTVSEEGVSISAPFYLDDKWDHEGYHLAEYGSIHEKPGEGMPQQRDPRIWQAMQEDMVEVFCPWHSDDDLSESE